jgi:3-oxoacyl-[acyl-carrier-protein] synthase III
MAPRMLDGGGIQSRHLAIDPETHRLTHTVAGLSEQSARRALEQANRKPADVELLVLACPNYDYSTPPTSTILQERLGIERCAEMEVHSNCSGVGKIVQIAYDALRTGRYRTALVNYAQLSSVYLRSCYFNQPQMTKTQAALRYILADGAGSLFLEAVDAEPGEPVDRELVGTLVESIGMSKPPGMTAGAGVADLVEPDSQVQALYAKGHHHLDQDFTAVNRDAGPTLLDGIVRLLESLNIDPATVDHYVYSIPTMQLYNGNLEAFSTRLHTTAEQMKFRACRTGYCGGASILLHFDEMVRSGEIKPGQLVALHSVESSKWMTAGFVVRW